MERRGHCPRGNARRVQGRRAWRSGSWTLPRELSSGGGGGGGAGFLLREAPVAARGGERGGGDSAAGSAGAGPPPRDPGREGGREGRSGGRAQEEGGRPLALAALPWPHYPGTARSNPPGPSPGALVRPLLLSSPR